MLLIGSKALNNYIDKDYKDIDFIATMDEVNYLEKKLCPEKIIENGEIITFINIQTDETYDRNNVEFLITDKSSALTKYYNLVDDHSFDIKVAPKEVLYSLKKSHIFYPIKFRKHIIDYNTLYNLCDKVDILEQITKLNKKETEDRIGKLKTPKLNKTTKEFFGQSNGFVKSYFIHDDIHRMVAHQDNPIFEKLQKKEGSVWCSKDLWEILPHIEKIYCVLEEAYVISLERLILPFLYDGKKYYSYDKAVEWALMRVCTTLCSGYFREFAVNNYIEIKENINPTFINEFLCKVDSNKIEKII